MISKCANLSKRYIFAMNCKKHEKWEKFNTKPTKKICKSQAKFFSTTQHQLENLKSWNYFIQLSNVGFPQFGIWKLLLSQKKFKIWFGLLSKNILYK